MPVTVAGPHRHHTGFRVPHSRRIVDANLGRRVLHGKRSRDALLQLSALTLVIRSRLAARVALVLRVQCRELGDQTFDV